MRLELGIMAGAESKVWLADLTKQIDRLERLTGGKGLKVDASEETEEAEEIEAAETTDDAEEDFAPKKGKPSKKAAAFDDDEEETETEETSEHYPAIEEEESFDAAPVKKAKKSQDVTIKQVNEACKVRARLEGKKGKKGVDVVKGILLKKFKTDSLQKIGVEHYPAIVAAMAV